MYRTMQEQEIIEGNKLIAEFMGYQILHKKFQYQNFNSSNESYFANGEGKIVCDKDGHEVNLYPDGDPLEDLSELPFNSSWDWLMPVVEKIEEIEVNNGAFTDYYDVHIMPDAIIINKQSDENNPLFINNKSDGCGSVECSMPTFENKMTALFYTVVEFIKWYNENEKD